MKNQYLQINKNDRQVFWDTYLIDAEKTTAELHVNHPCPKETVFCADALWEGDGTTYYNFFKDGDIYRMYYIAVRYSYRSIGFTLNSDIDKGHQFFICYAESKDGIHWEKPDLGIIEYKGTEDKVGFTENNIIIAPAGHLEFDSCFVLKDTNPACPKDELYKAVVMEHHKDKGQTMLVCYTSTDAVHFKRAWVMMDKGSFDTLNTVTWDDNAGIYRCYMRGKHPNNGKNPIGFSRDIRCSTSPDFKNWTEQKMIEFDDEYEFEMYTNLVSKYYRCKNVFIGFPTRYVERSFDVDYWTDNYEQLGGKSHRQYRMRTCEPRLGLSVTDCVFIVSHDGDKWHRFNEAFLTPGPEKKDNWVYGDCYPAYGLFESKDENGITELSMLSVEGHFFGSYSCLRRFTIRLDGFASYHAGYEQKTIVTKPLLLNGDTLEINFKTSAAGNIYIRLLDEQGNPLEGYESCELFGDSTARRVAFDKSLTSLRDTPVRLEIKMSDAEIFSFILL